MLLLLLLGVVPLTPIHHNRPYNSMADHYLPYIHNDINNSFRSGKYAIGETTVVFVYWSMLIKFCITMKGWKVDNEWHSLSLLVVKLYVIVTHFNE